MKKSKRNLDFMNYFKNSKVYFLFSITVFIYSILAAMILPVPFGIEEMIKNMLRELVDNTSNLGVFGLILFIFKNNVLVSIFALFMGVFIGIVPLIIIISNGYILGYVMDKVVLSSGIFELWRLLPHGIFELPAFFISVSLGIKLGMFFFSKNPELEFKKRIIYSFKIILFIIIPLLLVAAIIEGLLISLFS